jgi:DNA-binding MarR family transcriptional regulator
MQPFETPTVPADRCAAILLDTMPRVLKAVRVGLADPACALTVPQYRALLFVHEHQGASLSQLAEFMGLTLPSASKLVDHLVDRAIFLREPSPDDRRKMNLRISRTGDALFKSAQGRVRRHLAGMLVKAKPDALHGLSRALNLLHD